MMTMTLNQLLIKLADLIQRGEFEQLETDRIEIKPCPSGGNEWSERYKTVNAFLNTRGGVLLLGVREEQGEKGKKYVLSGWNDDAEPKVKEFARLFADRRGTSLDLSDCFTRCEIVTLLDTRVALVYVDELSADRKFVFYRTHAWKRQLTGDHRISENEIDQQEEYREQVLHARELLPIEDVSVEALDLDKLNQYITSLNQPARVETLKPDMVAAMPFLERKGFVKDGKVTTLGMLVCGKYPGDYLQFRAQVHCYVDVPNEIARDKQDLCDNVLGLMSSSLAYLMRNTQVGISPAAGGTAVPQYPDELLRETVNNALAHRDYGINRQVIIAVKPNRHVAIQNPGMFRRNLLIEADSPLLIRRIKPEAKARNPRLADVLRVFRKWEGRGIGMATLVSICLNDQIDIPYYRFQSDEVTLHLQCGRLLDERMLRLFGAYDGYIEQKMRGNPLTRPQQLVLAYLLKSQWVNQGLGYTILLTPDNNHFCELLVLEQAGLIHKHSLSDAIYPLYIVDEVLSARDYLGELRELYRTPFDALQPLQKDVLGVVYRAQRFSKAREVSAKQVAFDLWYSREQDATDIAAFDAFYRSVRSAFNRLEKAGYLRRTESKRFTLGSPPDMPDTLL